MTTEKKPTPTPTAIDDLCLKFDTAKIAVEKAEQNLSTAKGDLLEVVQDFGYTPTNAEKTTRLEGALYVADATVATSVSMNEAPIGELQSELSRLKKPKLFGMLFERKVKHSLKKGAGSTLKVEIGGLETETQKRILGLFVSCFSVDSKAPALTVELATALRQKEAEAQAKADAKAAKAAKKAEREALKAAKVRRVLGPPQPPRPKGDHPVA
jgi:hypothetical protein